MGLQKITFDGGNVTAKIDADLHHFLFSNTIGILKGIKSEVNYSLANNTITFQDGYVAIYGRLIYVETNTTVNVTSDSSKLGYVVLAVDTNNNTVNLYTKEQTGSYPSLVTTNLIINNGLYEFPLCAYSKTTTSVTINNNYNRSFIQTPSTLADTAKKQVLEQLSYYRPNLVLVQSGMYKFDNTNSTDLDRSLIVAVIGYNTTVTIPGALLFIQVGSTTSVKYSYGSSLYTMFISYANGTVTLTCGDTTHRITSLFIYR